MDAEKTGLFIAKLRKERGLTQRELADKIGVTDKAISKWERGHGFPDVAILETLSNELGVTIAELISGERATPETAAAQSNSALVETLLYVKRMSRKTVGTLIIIFGACLLGSPRVFAGFYLPLYVMGIIVTAGGIFMLVSKKSFANWGFPKIVLEGISLAALAAAIFLEIHPNGVVMWWWAPPDVETGPDYYSYFDMLPFGYAVFPPFITAMLTVAATIFTVIVMLLDKRFTKPRNALFVCIIVTIAASVCAFVFYFRNTTMISLLITLALVISAVFRAAANSTRQ